MPRNERAVASHARFQANGHLPVAEWVVARVHLVDAPPPLASL